MEVVLIFTHIRQIVLYFITITYVLYFTIYFILKESNTAKLFFSLGKMLLNTLVSDLVFEEL